LIFEQGLQVSTAGCSVALTLFFPIVRLIEAVSPEVSTKTSVGQIAAIVLAVWGMSFFSSLLALGRVRRIYSLEAFS
jgi:hypothetical protein